MRRCSFVTSMHKSYDVDLKCKPIIMNKVALFAVSASSQKNETKKSTSFPFCIHNFVVLSQLMKNTCTAMTIFAQPTEYIM